jgi:hypothetical protein
MTERDKDMASRNSRGGGSKGRRVANANGLRHGQLATVLAAAPGTLDDVMRCTSALSRPARRLSQIYPASTILLAMLDQTAGFLRSLLEAGSLSRPEVIRYCREFGQYVLARGVPQIPPAGEDTDYADENRLIGK